MKYDDLTPLQTGRSFSPNEKIEKIGKNAVHYTAAFRWLEWRIIIGEDLANAIDTEQMYLR